MHCAEIYHPFRDNESYCRIWPTVSDGGDRFRARGTPAHTYMAAFEGISDRVSWDRSRPIAACPG